MANIFVIETVFVMFVLVLGGSGRPFAKHYKDMSHLFNNETIYGPFGQKAQWTLEVKVYQFGDLRFAAGDFMAGEHGGTHIDAPYHMAVEHGWTLDQIPLDRLRAPAVVVDIRQEAALNIDYRATVADMQKWEERHGRMPEDAIVLICSDWDKKWPDKQSYLGTSDYMNISSYHFPAIHAELADWLVTNRKLVGMGIDTLSPDNTLSPTMPVHHTLASRNLIILENVKAVCDIPHHGATLLMIPMSVEGATGGPVRVIATWGDDLTAGAVSSHVIQTWAILLTLFCWKFVSY